MDARQPDEPRISIGVAEILTYVVESSGAALKRFLIIRFSSIGDIVLTTPVIRCLKTQQADCEIHYVTKKQFLPLLEANPFIDRLHAFDGNLSSLVAELKPFRFDAIFDLHGSLRSRLLTLILRRKSYVFPKLNAKKWLMVKFKIDLLPRIHIVDRYLSTLKKFNIKNDNKGLDYFIPPAGEVDLQSLPSIFHQGFIVVATGGKHNTKQITTDQMIELCGLLKYPVILLGGSEDAAKAEEVSARSGKDIFNGCGQYSLNQSASLLKQARVVIAPDTGIMHIAAALKKPVLSIWGNTIPGFGMYPYMPDPRSVLFETIGLSCRPCSKLGYPACPKGHFRCMLNHSMSDIAVKANLF